MPDLCPAPSPDAPLVPALSGAVDCGLHGVTQGAYALLARPDSAVAMTMTALLTIYVAVMGYRMMLGRAPLRVGDLTVSALKIGLVVLLASQWGAYQTLVYDTLTKGPQQIAGAMMPAMQPSGSVFHGNPFQGLQIAYDQLSRSASLYSGHGAANASALQGGPGFAAFALNSSAFLLLMSTLGVTLAAKVALTLLLALAPVFAGLLLFDATRGLVEGWLRASVAFAFAPLAAALMLAAELTVLEPLIVQLAQMEDAGRFDLAPPTMVFTLILVFAGVMAGLIVAGVMIAKGLRLPRRVAASAAEASAVARETSSLQSAQHAAAQAPHRDRATAVAAAAAAMERRESGGAAIHHLTERRTGEPGPRARSAGADTREPLGNSFRRINGPRRSVAGGRRDS